MFDTVAFNRILDQSIALDSVRSEFKFYATHIQEDELKNTPNEARREQLLRIFAEFVGPESTMPSETMVWGVGRWGQGKWGASGGKYSEIKSRLDRLKKKKNNIQDALIAETAILNNLCLVTDDENLFEATREFGGQTISVHDFLKEALRAESNGL